MKKVLETDKIIDHESKDYVPNKYLNRKKIIITYKGSPTTMEWIAELDKNFIKQKDEVNCGPIACLSVLEMFQGKKILDRLEVMNYRPTVMKHFQLLLTKFENDM